MPSAREVGGPPLWPVLLVGRGAVQDNDACIVCLCRGPEALKPAFSVDEGGKSRGTRCNVECSGVCREACPGVLLLAGCSESLGIHVCVLT